MVARLTVGVLCALLSIDVHAQSPPTPTDEEIRSFITEYDGETRPDLITPWIRLQIVLGDADVFDVVRKNLNESDQTALTEFRQRSIEVDQAGSKLFAEMFEKLCRDIGELDGREIADRVAKIDLAIEDRRSTAVETLMSRMSPAGAQAIMDHGGKGAARVKGSHTDIVGFAKRFPEHVKTQYTERCVSFGLINAPIPD